MRVRDRLPSPFWCLQDPMLTLPARLHLLRQMTGANLPPTRCCTAAYVVRRTADPRHHAAAAPGVRRRHGGAAAC